jgi:alkane 1-monooxygenase
MKLRQGLGRATPLVLPASYLLSFSAGFEALVLAPALVLFAATPLLDAVLPRDRSAPSRPSAFAETLPVLYLALFVACLAATAVRVAGGAAGWPYLLAAALSLGSVGGVAVCASHELLHGTDRRRRWVGRVGMWLVGYGHFEIAHLNGHHRDVGTLEDYSTARRGESLYGYLRRAIPSCFRFAVAEARRNGWTWPSRHPASPSVSLALSLALALAAGVAAGPEFVVVLLVQAGIAIGLLESTSYVEHYGLVRTTRAGRTERFRADHSWDSDHALSNDLLFRLPRHADHHLHPARGFARLEVRAGARSLPAGYPAMILLAMVPVAWRRAMDPLLEDRGRADTVPPRPTPAGR